MNLCIIYNVEELKTNHSVTFSVSKTDFTCRQRWATATLKIASLLLSLFAENNSGTTLPVTE